MKVPPSCPDPSADVHDFPTVHNPLLAGALMLRGGKCDRGHPYRIRDAFSYFEGSNGEPAVAGKTKCKKCRGAGILDQTHMCMTCHGTGFRAGSISWAMQRGVRGKIAGPSVDMCRACGGMRSARAKVPCSECKGTGMVDQ
jgi:DnaJ-class molecular chaperone